MTMPKASIAEVAPDLYRINVAMPPELIPGGFSFNQYLLLDDKPLLFHTGPLFDETAKILIHVYLFTQGGAGSVPLLHEDLVDASESFRRQMDYYSHSENAPALIEN